MKIATLLVISFFSTLLTGQSTVGINTNDPGAILDIRGLDDNTFGGDLLIATPGGQHFMRLFGGRGLDPKPFLLFANTDTFRIATSNPSLSKFSDLLTVRPDGNVGIGEGQPQQKLSVDGKLRVGNDNSAPQEGTIRYDETQNNFDGYNGTGWVTLNNKLIYQDQKLSINIGSTVRNSEVPWGDTITIAETGNYMLFVSAYFSSTINEQYDYGTPSASAPMDNRGRLKIYINDSQYKLLECGNGIIDRAATNYQVSFAPGTRSFMEVVYFEEGDKVNLTRNMQAIPAFTPNLSIPDLWICSMDAFFIMKLD